MFVVSKELDLRLYSLLYLLHVIQRPRLVEYEKTPFFESLYEIPILIVQTITGLL